MINSCLKKSLLVLGLVLGPIQIFAQIPVAENNISVTGDFLVSPANKELLVKPGTSAGFDLSITNRTGRTATFLIGVEDLDQAYYESTNSDITKELSSLKDYLERGHKEITLAHGEKISLPIVVRLPGYVSEESLYGAVTVALFKNEQATNGLGAVLQTRIAVPILVRTSEVAKTSGGLLTFGTAQGKSVFSSTPVTLKIVYENTGQVHIRPNGKLVVKNIFGQIVYERVVEPWYILPGSIRSRTVDVGSGSFFGPYTAHLTLSGGGKVTVEQAKVRFWVLPPPTILIIFLAIFLIVFIRRWVRRAAQNKSLS